MPKKDYIESDYTLNFHSSSEKNFQPIIGNYDVSFETTEDFTGVSWTGSQGAAVGDFPRYDAFSSSFGNRWIQPFSGSQIDQFMINKEATQWDDAGITNHWSGQPGFPGHIKHRNPSIGWSNKFTKDGKLYTMKADTGNHYPGSFYTGILELVSGSEGAWRANDWIPAGTASFSTVSGRSFLNASGSSGGGVYGEPYSTGRYAQFDILEVTPDLKYACIISGQSQWIDPDDHSAGFWPNSNNSSFSGVGGLYGQMDGWRHLIYRSSSANGWYQETFMDTRDFDAYCFEEDISGNKVNKRYQSYVWDDFFTSPSNIWRNDASSPAGTGRSWDAGTTYAGHPILFQANHDQKIRLAWMLTGHQSTELANRTWMVVCQSGSTGWFVEDLTYIGYSGYVAVEDNGTLQYEQNRNEFYYSGIFGEGTTSHKFVGTIMVISSASSGVYYEPGEDEIEENLSARGGYKSVSAWGTNSQVYNDIVNGTELYSSGYDMINLKALGLTDSLSEYDNKEEWELNELFGKKFTFDSSGRMFVATRGRRKVLNTDNADGLLRSYRNKVYVLNSSSVNPSNASPSGWYIEQIIDDPDYASGGLLEGKDDYWFDDAEGTGGYVNSVGQYFYGNFGASLGAPMFMETASGEPLCYLFVGAPTTALAKNKDIPYSYSDPVDEPRGAGYLYKSASVGGWTLAQKFENPTNFLSSSANDPRSAFHRELIRQHINSLGFTGIAYILKSTTSGWLDADSSFVWRNGVAYQLGRTGHTHAFSGSVLAVATPMGSELATFTGWYPFERTKMMDETDTNSSNLATRLETGSGGGSIVFYDGNAEYQTTITRNVTRTVDIVDGPVPTRVGNTKGAFNIRGQDGNNSYRVSIGDKKK